MALRNGNPAKSTTSRSRTKAGQSQSGNQMRDAADAVISRTEKGIEAAREASDAYLAQGREAVESIGSRAVDFVRDRPLQAIAIAAGAGALLAWLTRRS